MRTRGKFAIPAGAGVVSIDQGAVTHNPLPTQPLPMPKPRQFSLSDLLDPREHPGLEAARRPRELRRFARALAAFKGTESALMFGSGYVANLGVIPGLIGPHGLILADRLCHASLIDGCRLSGADFRVFRHRDSSHVESLLKRRAAKRPTLIVTDGLFSMDGDVAPLPELASLAKQYDAMVYVDDAHGTAAAPGLYLPSKPEVAIAVVGVRGDHHDPLELFRHEPLV